MCMTHIGVKIPHSALTKYANISLLLPNTETHGRQTGFDRQKASIDTKAEISKNKYPPPQKKEQQTPKTG